MHIISGYVYTVMQATKLIFVYCTIMTIVIQLLSMLCHKIQGGIHETLAFYEKMRQEYGPVVGYVNMF